MLSNRPESDALDMNKSYNMTSHTSKQVSVETSSVGIDSFVSGCPHSLAYHRSDFLGVVSRELGAEPLWIVVRSAGEIVGVMPIAMKSGTYGIVVNSLPYFGSNGAVIQKNDDVAIAKLLIAEFERFCSDLPAAAWTIITNPLDEKDGFYQEELDWNFKDFRYSYVTTLEAGRSFLEFVERFDDPRPRNVRRAIRSGVEIIEKSSEDALLGLSRLHQSNMREIGAPFKTEAFFLDVARTMGRDSWGYHEAEIEGKTVAGLLVLKHGQTVEYYTPAVDPLHRASQASSLLIATVMHKLGNDGYRFWNWGGTGENQHGVRNFKKKWDCREGKYYYFTKVVDHSLFRVPSADLTQMYPGFFVYPFDGVLRNSVS